MQGRKIKPSRHKDSLLNNHILTDFHQIERLGSQHKLAELLAHLVELTPADELQSKYR